MYRFCTGYLKVKCRVCTGYVQGMYKLCAGNIQVMYRVCTGYVQGMYRLCAGNLHSLCLRYVEVIHMCVQVSYSCCAVYV